MTQRDVTPLVIEDLKARTERGTKEYGEPLRTFNGRNALRDLYEELLDAAQYAKQRLVEEDAVVAETSIGLLKAALSWALQGVAIWDWSLEREVFDCGVCGGKGIRDDGKRGVAGERQGKDVLGQPDIEHAADCLYVKAERLSRIP